VNSDEGVGWLASGQHPVLRPPLVLQQYVAHGSHLYKVSTAKRWSRPSIAFWHCAAILCCAACCYVGMHVLPAAGCCLDRVIIGQYSVVCCCMSLCVVPQSKCTRVSC
jgi:hypothetical protein